MKKTVSIILTVCLLAAMIPLGAFTTFAETTSGKTGDCTWTLNGTELTISGKGEIGNYSYNTPSWKTTAPWGANITKVTIAKGVTSIGDCAFFGCASLKSITIPDSVTNIGIEAFIYCSSLTSVSIPDSVTSIGKDAFANCVRLKSITIPNSVTSIDGYAFDSCTGLEQVNITDIGAWCKIKFENSISNPLYYAEQLILNGKKANEIVIPQNLTAINAYAFENLSTLKSVKIPKTVTSIGTDAFSECIRLDNVYYGGNEADWKKITIESGNKYLESAEITYNCYSFVSDLDDKKEVNNSDDGTSSNVNTLDDPKPNASTSDDTNTDADNDNGGENKTNSEKKDSSSGEEIEYIESDNNLGDLGKYLLIGGVAFGVLVAGGIVVLAIVLKKGKKKKKKKSANVKPKSENSDNQ